MTNEEQGGSLMNQQMQTAPGTAAQPPAQLKTNRSLLKFILLSLITFGIYGIVVMSSISNDINLIAGRYDGKKTMHYCLLIFIVGPITCGIATLVWHHKLSARIGAELGRRGKLQFRSIGLLALERGRFSDCCRTVHFLQ